MNKRALITGITGQSGSYLAEFLLNYEYKVFGLIRKSSAGPNLRNIAHIEDQLTLIPGDMTDADSLSRAVATARPDEIYNLAAQSFVPMSWASPTHTINVNLGGFVYLLEAVRNTIEAGEHKPRIYQASTSEMYGDSGANWIAPLPIDKQIMGTSLNEDSAMRPLSPYGISKLAAHRMAEVYRKSFGMFICSGILFNHESPRRGEMFVTRKITKAVAEIIAGKRDKLKLGNLQARRDWGFAGDFVRAMWLMLQQNEPQDFVIGTGITHSVEDCFFIAFEVAQEVTGKTLHGTPESYIEVDKSLERPAEINFLRANYERAKDIIGWTPSVDFRSLIKMMVSADLEDVGFHKADWS